MTKRSSKKNPCWSGYERVPGTKKYSKGSCRKKKSGFKSLSYKKKTSKKPYKVTIKNSNRSGKKKMAIFYNKEGKKIKTTHFGSAGMSDYTKNKDPERKTAYLARHKKRENWNDPTSAGALSRWILWNKPSYSASVSSYKRKFGLK